jgi:hypothetical protein
VADPDYAGIGAHFARRSSVIFRPVTFGRRIAKAIRHACGIAREGAQYEPQHRGVANALAGATGVRFPDLPFTPDRIFSKLAEQP